MANNTPSAATTRQPEEVTLEERDLLDRLRRDDEGAYEELVRAVGGRLLAVARRISRTEQDAEDAVQEAFLSAFRSLPQFDGRSSLSTWLHRIVVNAAVRRARASARRNESSIDALVHRFDASGDYADRPQPWAHTPDDPHTRLQTREALTRAIDELPDEYRTVILLRDVYGHESRAVAASLGISDALVRQRLHRARQALTKLLEPAMAEQNR